jgi:hypothetical protein
MQWALSEMNKGYQRNEHKRAFKGPKRQKIFNCNLKKVQDKMQRAFVVLFSNVVITKLIKEGVHEAQWLFRGKVGLQVIREHPHYIFSSLEV